MSRDDEAIREVSHILSRAQASDALTELVRATVLRKPDDRSQLVAIWAIATERGRYRRRGSWRPMEASAEMIMEIGFTDADDMTTLIVALLRAAGFPFRIRVATVAAGGPWHHVYPLAGVPKDAPQNWIPLDVCHAPYAGVESLRIAETKDLHTET